MSKKLKTREKFSFTPEFQLEVLRYILKDKDGFTALLKVKPGYLTLIEHSIIAEGLHKFFKKNNRMPSKPILKEVIKNLLEGKDYNDLVTVEDIPEIHKVIDNLYSQHLKDSDIIQEEIYKFAAYVEMKNLSETFDLENYGQYTEYQNQIAKIINSSKPEKEEGPLMMVSGVIKRQFDRQASPSVIPTPFRQLNDLTNGGGYPKGSIVVLLDKAKAKKTFTLVNVARGYLRMKKNVLYIDTENGKAEIMGRMIQSTLNKSKKDLQSGEHDKLEQKHVRKYKRIGVEFIVERVPAMISNINHVRAIKKRVEAEIGEPIHILILDYAAKLASIDGHKDDNDRLFNVYVELQNMAIEENLDSVWTANHITREGSKHKTTRYEENDIASAISIIRNAQAIIGLNSTAEEEENDIQRMEIVVQRDGKPFGRALFNLNVDNQRMNEFTKVQRDTYDQQYGDKLEKAIKKKTNPNANTKEVTGSGDI